MRSVFGQRWFVRIILGAGSLSAVTPTPHVVCEFDGLSRRASHPRLPPFGREVRDYLHWD